MLDFLTHHLHLNDCSPLLPLTQGPQWHTVVTRSFKLPNPSHLCEKLVLTSILCSNPAYFASESSFYAAMFNSKQAAASTKALPTTALRCFYRQLNTASADAGGGERGAGTPSYSFCRGDEGLLPLISPPPLPVVFNTITVCTTML